MKDFVINMVSKAKHINPNTDKEVPDEIFWFVNVVGFDDEYYYCTKGSMVYDSDTKAPMVMKFSRQEWEPRTYRKAVV